MKTIKFKNQKAYEAYKFILNTCDSHDECSFCPFFTDDGCVFQQEINRQEVAEEKCKHIEELKKQIKELQKHIANLDETICKQEAQLSESYDASHIKVRDDMIFSLEKQLSDVRNELIKNNMHINSLKDQLATKDRYVAKLEKNEEGHCTEISILKAELARKNRYITKLEQQIANVKEALKND